MQQTSGWLADLEEEQKNDVVHTMFKRPVVPGEMLIRQGVSRTAFGYHSFLTSSERVLTGHTVLSKQIL